MASDAAADSPLNIVIELSGGLEYLFQNRKRFPLALTRKAMGIQEENTKINIRHLIAHLKANHVTERPELFVAGDSVRPGILVLINDADWELENELEYEIKEGDKIVFISTLHGG